MKKESLVIHRDTPLENIYVQPLTTEKINELGEAIRDSNSITLRYQITKEEFEELIK